MLIPKVVEVWHICSLMENTESAPDKLMHRNIFSDFIKELELYGSSTFIDNHDDSIKFVFMMKKNTFVSFQQ